MRPGSEGAQRVVDRVPQIEVDHVDVELARFVMPMMPFIGVRIS